MTKKKFYLTVAIPYVNAKPHIGHALEFVQGDVVARWHRQRGEDVFYVSGADENSLKNVQAAEKLGISPKQLCDENAKAFVEFARALNVQFDVFYRSSSPEHIASSQELWRRCDVAGDIYKKQYRGLYCVGCELFYTRAELNERGECFEHSGKPLEEVEEENYFFRLSKYQKQLDALIASDRYHIVPEGKKNEALSFMRAGLEDFSISRSVTRARGWGVPVPDDPAHIMYVWFDALNVYRSAAPDRWPADLHVIGKGILRFHAVYWPAILLSAKLPLPKELFVHGYVTVDGAKMSKTTGNVVDPIALVEKYGADAVRYYFLREISPYDDGDYSEEKFKTRYNADLANGLGNFAARVLTLGVGIGDFGANRKPAFGVTEKIEATKKLVEEKIASFKFNEALAAIWDLIAFGDEYVNAKSPWKIADSQEKAQALFDLVVVLDNVAALVTPYLPDAAGKISKCIAWDGDVLRVQRGAVLFPRIE
ncbi:MAG: methionine--tRNA ligase [Candidatus Liptonbacteria bacterium RIFCSPLOWO2_01_FULL_52_25]|uniref:Methionine--tRNA ligase n=1 Tax=Candidatus Liptonbacteria bacterium RIFCSPLOWO2_01_FULL_52_25 TaxID=1798650 RepID=A0A1G2CFY8_9BACT|nr:MAG: methionine--tRNA ligase [Candidatus Liptonbacteria bacterium RIFCSPLOWO2_01_FULL_52_25]